MKHTERTASRRDVVESPLWQRLRWDEDDWHRHPLASIDETVRALAEASRGQELAVVKALVDLLDETVYSNALHVVLQKAARPTAVAFADQINRDGCCGQGLRAALNVAPDMDSLIVGLIEVVLSSTGAR